MCWFTVKQQQVAIVQQFGKHSRVAGAGIHFLIPFVETVAARLDLRIQELHVRAETKTKDNVFVHMSVAVQYQVQNPYDAYYKLSNPQSQIESSTAPYSITQPEYAVFDETLGWCALGSATGGKHVSAISHSSILPIENLKSRNRDRSLKENAPSGLRNKILTISDLKILNQNASGIFQYSLSQSPLWLARA